MDLKEYRVQPDVELTLTEVAALRKGVPGLTIEPEATAGRYCLTPASHVGIIRVGDLEVEIRPKIGFSRLFFLVSYALDPSAWRNQDVQFASDTDLAQAILPGFLYQAERALGRGPLQGYRSVDETTSGLRGRIRFGDQLRRHHGHFYPLEATFDDFSIDIVLNQVLKAALRRVGSMRIQDLALRDRLHHALSRLSLVRDETLDTRALAQLTFDRLNAHYRPSIELARLILRSMSVEFRDGHVVSSAFVVDMNEVFENFVVAGLREALGVGEAALPQCADGRRLFLDRDERVRIRPDLSWWEHGRCGFVGDVKYKSLDTRGFLHADLYQLLAYAIAAGVPEALLIYAAQDSHSAPFHVLNSGKLLEVRALSLGGGSREILKSIRGLADHIAAMKARAATPQHAS